MLMCIALPESMLLGERVGREIAKYTPSNSAFAGSPSIVSCSGTNLAGRPAVFSILCGHKTSAFSTSHLEADEDKE